MYQCWRALRGFFILTLCLWLPPLQMVLADNTAAGFGNQTPPGCIPAPDVSDAALNRLQYQTSTQQVTVPAAQSQWVDTGYVVQKGNNVTIMATGVITQCTTTSTITANPTALNPPASSSIHTPNSPFTLKASDFIGMHINAMSGTVPNINNGVLDYTIYQQYAQQHENLPGNIRTLQQVITDLNNWTCTGTPQTCYGHQDVSLTDPGFWSKDSLPVFFVSGTNSNAAAMRGNNIACFYQGSMNYTCWVNINDSNGNPITIQNPYGNTQNNEHPESIVAAPRSNHRSNGRGQLYNGDFYTIITNEIANEQNILNTPNNEPVSQFGNLLSLYTQPVGNNRFSRWLTFGTELATPTANGASPTQGIAFLTNPPSSPATLGGVVIPNYPGGDVATGNYQLDLAKTGCVVGATDTANADLSGQLQLYIGPKLIANIANGGLPAPATYSVTGGSLTLTNIPQSGNIWVRILDTDGNYGDNTNSYDVVITSTMMVDNRSVFGSFIQVVQNELNLVAEQMFRRSVKNASFQNLLRTLVLLYVIITFALFMLGHIEEPMKAFLIRTVKIGVVLALIGPNSWNFFYNNLLSLFVEGRDQLITLATGGNQSSSVFSFIDTSMGLVFNSDLSARLLALIFSPFSGGWAQLPLVWLIIICYSAFIYAWCLLEAAVVYCSSIVMVSLLLVVAPLFVSFLLFETTKVYFQDYLKHLFMFALQPVILFIALTFVNSIVFLMYAAAFNFQVCSSVYYWLSLLDVPQSIAAMFGSLSVYQINPPIPPSAVVETTWRMIGFLMVVMLMQEIVAFSAKLTAFLTDTQEAEGSLKLGLKQSPREWMKKKADKAESQAVSAKAGGLKKQK